MLRRSLSESEAALHATGRCICCGQPVKSYRERKGGEPIYPYDCPDCARMSASHDAETIDFGPARASLQTEFARRIGAPLRGIQSAQRRKGDDGRR